MKLAEIAARIDAHLKRFEADPQINALRRYDPNTRQWEKDDWGLPSFYQAGAHASGTYVWVRYIVYQGRSGLRKADALRYLAWLDEGNVGRHHTAGIDTKAFKSR